MFLIDGRERRRSGFNSGFEQDLVALPKSICVINVQRAGLLLNS